MTTRRHFLAGAAAAGGVALLPAAAVDAAANLAPTSPPPPPAPPNLAWRYDRGDYAYTVIAPDKASAHAEMIAQHFDHIDDACPRNDPDSDDECTIEDCGCHDEPPATIERDKNLDAAAARGEITLDDYNRAGWGMVCDRCGGEPMSGDWEVVADTAVCNDCITIDEWRVINPQHAADLEEDARRNAEEDGE